MRVLHITSVMDGRINCGTARVASELIHQLNEQEGIDQTFLHFDLFDYEIYRLQGTTEILVTPVRKLWGARYLGFLKFALIQRYLCAVGRRQRLDIVHWDLSRIYPLFFLNFNVTGIANLK